MRRTTVAVVAALAAITIAIVGLNRHKEAGEADLSTSGAILEYEASSRSLTLQTDDGQRRFLVQDNAAVHAGARTLTHADLMSSSGCRAKVWYRAARRLWTAYEIRLSCGRSGPDRVTNSAAPERP